ncbi:OTU protein [Vermiconidia calcicola]|uniref:OTU protein n=1 Tax=Vermiconidia calcicola TaxID=1690605 RepID=A0ACC3N1K5_9PEZI|nr:OTU protein [Vermiconidia calcicola]
MEELQARHRKEQRDLQSQITQKKKQASKKTRKAVNEECDKLEVGLKQRHATEVAAMNGQGVEDANGQLEDLTLDGNGHEEEPAPNGTHQDENPQRNGSDVQNEDVGAQSKPKKGNRQKARLARRAAEQEELVKQAAEEAKNLPDLKQQERGRMLESMKERGLREKEIRADGHCLYSAVADQLEQLNIPIGTKPSSSPSVPIYRVVRAAAADYIEKHRDDYEPFLEEPLPDYLHKIRDTGEWGGQLELMALAKTYGTDINVLQDFGRVEKIESGSSKGDNENVMWLGYYKHGFGLGEHYNSLRKAG